MEGADKLFPEVLGLDNSCQVMFLFYFYRDDSKCEVGHICPHPVLNDTLVKYVHSQDLLFQKSPSPSRVYELTAFQPRRESFLGK